MKIIYSVFLTIAIFTLPMTASALTFKKGQILGPDGKVYDGASPQLRARLIAEAEAGGKSAGVAAGQLFVVVKGIVTFVPLTEIAGKSDESVKDIVVEKVTETVTKALTIEALADAGVEVENLSEEALEAASEGDIAAALDEIANADIAGVAAAEAAEATKEAWNNISQEDLAEATAYAAEFAAQEAAKIAAAENISAQLDALIASGASEAEIDAFIEADPPE